MKKLMFLFALLSLFLVGCNGARPVMNPDNWQATENLHPNNPERDELLPLFEFTARHYCQEKMGINLMRRKHLSGEAKRCVDDKVRTDMIGGGYLWVGPTE